MDIQELLFEKLAEVDVEDLALQVVRDKIAAVFDTELRVKLSEIADEMIRKEIIAIMYQPIVVDDGFGHRREYANFEDLFKATLLDHMQSKWQFQGLVEKLVREHTAKLLEDQYSLVAKDIAERLTEGLK